MNTFAYTFLTSSAHAEGPVLPATTPPTETGGSTNQTTSATTTNATQMPTNPQPTWMQFAPMVALFAVLYFVMIRPQQKKMKEQQKMINELKSGDEVVTTSGILGVIRGLTDKVVTLEIADHVKIKVLKSQVNQVVKGQINDLA